MDIAKLRKKFRETAAAEAERPDTVQEETPKAEAAAPAETQARPDEHAEQQEGQPAAAESEVEEDTVQLLAFKIADEEYAFKIDEIEEIVRPQGITMIPNTAPYLLGITSLRGKIIPVVDLRKMLSLGGAQETNGKKRKVLILKGPKGPVGAMIDSVTGVIRPSVSKIVESPPHLREDETRFIEGVAIIDGRFISIIRIEEAVAIEV